MVNHTWYNYISDSRDVLCQATLLQNNRPEYTPHKQTMAPDKRFFGPLLSSAQHKSVFAGVNEDERMTLVRHQIVVVRKAWQSSAEYGKLLDIVRQQVRPQTHPKSVRLPFERLLQGFRDYADIDLGRPEEPAINQYDALELYCSKEGYDYLYRLISQTLRLEVLPQELLLTAVTMVELLTIDLYNLRLSHIGDAKYANFQGITHRGMIVDTKVIDEYREIALRQDLSKRNFAIPLAPISTSTDRSVMLSFTELTHDDARRLHWKVHIHGIDPDLMRAYHDRYPDSIVTSICAMPVGPVSPFGEKEILLRGVSFQLLRLTTEVIGGNDVDLLEVVMINANRDHTTELGSNEHEKKLQRDSFRRIAMASKYEVCASLALQFSHLEAAEYRKLQQRLLDELRDIDGIVAAKNEDLADARSGDVAVWLGGSYSKSFPRHYAELRKKLQVSAVDGKWTEVADVMKNEYDWRRGDWYNVAKLYDIGSVTRPGFNLLHEMAIAGPPSRDDASNYEAWKDIVEEVEAEGVWSRSNIH